MLKMGTLAYTIDLDDSWNSSCSAEPVTISQRNFDPLTRTLRKHDRNDMEEDETVETTVEGLAEKVIAEYEETRVQELVSSSVCKPTNPVLMNSNL